MRFVGALLGTVLGFVAGGAVLFVVASSVHTGDYGQVGGGGAVAMWFGLGAVPVSAALGAFLGWKAGARGGR